MRWFWIAFGWLLFPSVRRRLRRRRAAAERRPWTEWGRLKQERIRIWRQAEADHAVGLRRSYEVHRMFNYDTAASNAYLQYVRAWEAADRRKKWTAAIHETGAMTWEEREGRA